MSLVYAKKSDEIGMCFMCASRVSTYMRGELVSRILMSRNIKMEWPRSVRESTYIRSSLGSRRRSASRYLPHARAQDSLLRFVRFAT